MATKKTKSSGTFGPIPGIQVGHLFIDRDEAHALNVHRQTQAGICGRAAEGAESVVVSGGYVDDEDHGDRILYTGEGGRDPKTKKQVADQVLTKACSSSGGGGVVTAGWGE